MELKKAIENRRSIRKYKSMDVPDELIKDLIECARLAPSAKNRQPWKFLILKNDIKNQIADIMIEKQNSLEYCVSNVKLTAKIIKEAPVLILVLKEYEDNWIVGDSLSIGAAIEHICLRATDLGLGSLWIRDVVYFKKEIVRIS
jgi:nitroreductase